MKENENPHETLRAGFFILFLFFNFFMGRDGLNLDILFLG